MIPTQFLLSLRDRGILSQLYLYGMLPSKYSAILEIRLKVDSLMAAGKSKGQAVRIVSKQTGLTVQSIYNYLKA